MTAKFSLIDPVKWTWSDNGHEYPVNMAFDNVLRWFDLLGRNDISDGEKGVIGWHMFVNNDSVSPVARLRALDWINQYINQHPYHRTEENDEGEGAKDMAGMSAAPEDAFSYAQDAGAIWSSIRAYYGIDLQDEIGKLHWLKFRALLDGLPGDSYFMRIIAIRQRPRDGLQGKELADLIDLQDYYVLDQYRNAQTSSNAADFFAAWAREAQK